MISKKNIINLAEKVKNYVEKNQAIPSTVTGDVEYTWPQIWYILSWSINHLNKDLEKVPSVKVCTKATGDTINEKIKPGDYKDQSKRIVQYITQHGKAPNFVTSVASKKKINPKLSIYANARIIVWYSKNHILPSYCTYDSNAFKKPTNSNAKKTVVKKKHGHATKHGCDNMGQNNSVNCGPHSMQEVIRNLTGKVIKQSKLASWAGTGSGGTDHKGLETAIAKAGKELKVKFNVKWYNLNELGWNGLLEIIKSNNKDFIIHNLYRNKWGHYEVVNSISGSNVKVQNSLGDQSCGSCYCGYVENRTTSEFRSYINGISQKSVMVITRVD